MLGAVVQVAAVVGRHLGWIDRRQANALRRDEIMAYCTANAVRTTTPSERIPLSHARDVEVVRQVQSESAREAPLTPFGMLREGRGRGSPRA